MNFSKSLFTIPVISNLEEAKNYIENKREPCIFRGFDYGECLRKWNIQYLTDIVKNKSVKVHVSSFSDMDFIKKNFIYRTLNFDELIKRASEIKHENFFVKDDEKYYLRSLGSDERKDIADIRIEFPELAKDFTCPPIFDEKKYFSSVFRISSSDLRLWTHYDIMDNLLLQIIGKKRIVLFPPSEVEFLYMMGDKSQVLDVDNPDLEKYPLFSKAKRYECELLPGDGLFIPALWLHNVITKQFSIGINVFWRHLDDNFYDKKDIYGNKDLVYAQKAINSIEKSIKDLNFLPYEYKLFYTKRIIKMFEDNINST